MTDGSPDPQQDEEILFWTWFFERLTLALSPISKARATVMAGPLGGLVETVGQLSDDVSDTIRIGVQRTAELTYSAILRTPGTVDIILLLVSAKVGRYA